MVKCWQILNHRIRFEKLIVSKGQQDDLREVLFCMGEFVSAVDDKKVRKSIMRKLMVSRRYKFMC
jgi:hypothetical protein